MKTYARIQSLAVAELANFETSPVGRFHPSIVWQEVTASQGGSQVGVGWRQTATGFEPPVVAAVAAPTKVGVAELQAKLAALAAQIAVLGGQSA